MPSRHLQEAFDEMGRGHRTYHLPGIFLTVRIQSTFGIGKTAPAPRPFSVAIMYPRFLKDRILQYLKNFRIVYLTGPRQAGKTPLALAVAKETGAAFHPVARRDGQPMF